MVTSGTVREWHAEQGWGVLDSAATPGGCWAHFSSVRVAGCRELDPGVAVLFTFEQVDQDGFAFRAVGAWPAGQAPVDQVATADDRAYGSRLTITFDDEA